MPRENRNIKRLAKNLRALSERIPHDLFLPSLRADPPGVYGYAYKFLLTLPLFAADGHRVFLEEHLAHLHDFFDDRFGGCSGTSSRSGAPYFGQYRPTEGESVRDHNTITFVYANPIEASNLLFQELKSILRIAPLIPQDEILIERTEVYLV